MKGLIATIVSTFCAVFSANSIASDLPLIPRSILFGNPEKAMVRLSHDGKYISYIAPKDGVLNVWIAPREGIKDAKVITNDKGRGIREYYWSYDNTHVLYLQDHNGDENFRLYSYNINTHKTQLLTPEKNVRVVIYKSSRPKPDEILIGLNDRVKEYFDVYKLKLSDSSLTHVMKNDKYSGFIADDNLDIRFASLVNDNGEKECFEYKDGKWKLFIKIPMEDSKTTGILGFDKTNSKIYFMNSIGSDTAALELLDLQKNTSKIIAKDKKVDVGIFAVHPTEKNVQVVEIDYDRPKLKILDKKIKGDIDVLSKLHKGNFTITARSTDDNFWIVAYADDVMVPHYYLYDRPNKKTEFLFSSQSQLDAYQLQPMHPIVIKARDGLKLVSYLTLPEGKEFNKDSAPVPMVLYVHGGPWLRDAWGINPVHQWFANRGYAVLSVNFRGSVGFGKNFVNAGNLEWGRKMHDDLIDGVNWAIKHKIADPQKICIMGGSYGGYATLAGLTFTPDVFACGVDIVGPSNLITLMQSFPPYWKPLLSDMKKRVGSLDTENGQNDLKDRSPLTYAKNIIKPLLIAQGANDPRVKQAESDQIIDKMNKHNIPVVYALYPGEGHGFANPHNRLSFYAMTEQFLSTILGGRSEDIGADLTGADFTLNDISKPSASTVTTIIKDSILKSDDARR